MKKTEKYKAFVKAYKTLWKELFTEAMDENRYPIEELKKQCYAATYAGASLKFLCRDIEEDCIDRTIEENDHA